MKKIIPFVAAVFFALSSQAQTINVHMADGTTQKYGASKVDYVDFSNAIASPEVLEAVDLALPSGRKWANINVGATSPEDYGFYFAWGETQPKTGYSWDNYLWGKHVNDKTTIYKYNNSLTETDDAAQVMWGGKWRMPSKAEYDELLANTTFSWTTENGVWGAKFTAANGNYVFFPAAGYKKGKSVQYATSIGNYWASTLCVEEPYDAYLFAFKEEGDPIYVTHDRRCHGQSVRAVISAKDVSAASSAPAAAVAVDLGLPSGVLWANMNLGAEKVEDYGVYLAWGVTEPQADFGWANYKWGSAGSFTGYTGATVLEATDDAATANWGSEWRMPTAEEARELLENTTQEFIGEEDNYIVKLTGSNGNYIILPCASYIGGTGRFFFGSAGAYWTSTVDSDKVDDAFNIAFLYPDLPIVVAERRVYGQTVRPVKK